MNSASIPATVTDGLRAMAPPVVEAGEVSLVSVGVLGVVPEAPAEPESVESGDVAAGTSPALPGVPPVTTSPGRLTVALAARAWYSLSVREAFLAGLSGILVFWYTKEHEIRKRSSLLIDDHGHALLAMGALRAVDPDRSEVLDGNSVRGSVGSVSSDGHEARVEAGDIAVHADGLARLVEGGLSNGVVSCGELELHHISHGSLQVVGGEAEAAGLGANGDDVDIGVLRCEV